MAEMLEKWPEEKIGLGLLQNYRYGDRSTRIASKMAGGEDKTRLLSRDILRDHFFDMRLSPAQLAYLEWWVHNKIDMGEAWFEIDLHSAAGMKTSVAKIVKIGRASRQGQYYKISLQLLTRERPAVGLTEEQLEAMLEYGTSELQAAADTLHTIVHE